MFYSSLLTLYVSRDIWKSLFSYVFYRDFCRFAFCQYASTLASSNFEFAIDFKWISTRYCFKQIVEKSYKLNCSWTNFLVALGCKTFQKWTKSVHKNNANAWHHDLVKNIVEKIGFGGSNREPWELVWRCAWGCQALKYLFFGGCRPN